MVKVYYAKVFSGLSEDAFASYLDKVEEGRREKILAATNESVRLQSLTAGNLLHYALCERLGAARDKCGPFPINHEKGGKPYLTEYPGTYFNLSHSGGYVLCALGDAPVGVDVQKITKVKEEVAERFFTEKDRLVLAGQDGVERTALFFRMWSVKESYIKLTGKGLQGGLDTFEIDWEGRRVFEKGKHSPAAYFIEAELLPGYSSCLCTRKRVSEVVWKEVLTLQP